MLAKVFNAKSYLDLFPDEKHVKKTYLHLAAELHPDKFQNEDEKQRATDAFVVLMDFYNQAQDAVKNNTFGQLPKLKITTKNKTYEVDPIPIEGDICDVFFGDDIVIKIARSPKDNDLVEAEAKALRKMNTDGEDKFKPFVPNLIEDFLYKDAQRIARRTNICERIDGFHDLVRVRAHYSSGVNVLDMIWMWRRTLIALGFTHSAGVIHGAVTPEHILIHPEKHGLILTDWCYSSDMENRPQIKAVPPNRKGIYPPEVLAKSKPGPGTDIWLATQSMIYLIGGLQKTPRAIRAFFKGCMSHNETSRPQDAWKLLKEFDELLEQLGEPFHPRRFRAFRLE